MEKNQTTVSLDNSFRPNCGPDIRNIVAQPFNDQVHSCQFNFLYSKCIMQHAPICFIVNNVIMDEVIYHHHHHHHLLVRIIE